MIRVTKEQADDMVLDVFSSISRLPNIKPEFAKESIDIMKNPTDNSIISGILLLKARPKLASEEEENFQIALAGALSTFVIAFGEKDTKIIVDSGFDKELIEHLKQDNITTKLDFALMQFIQAWKEYGRLETQYPNVMDFL
jgi:hypothetical protein